LNLLFIGPEAALFGLRINENGDTDVISDLLQVGRLRMKNCPFELALASCKSRINEYRAFHKGKSGFGFNRLPFLRAIHV
jgi:hypothetical protein